MFKYVGIDLKQCGEYLTINQESYIDSIKEITIYNTSGIDKLQEINDSKLNKLFRGLVGKLN